MSPTAPKIVLLVNPVAGDRRGTRMAEAAARRLRHRGARVEVVTGSSAVDCRSNAAIALRRGSDVVAVVGGDGMVHLAAQLLAGTEVPLAVLPAGTANDFARTVGVPLRDPQRAADLVLDGTDRALDLGRVGDRWFCTVLTGGFDSRVAERAGRIRRPKGRIRYNLATLLEVRRLRPLPFELEIDSRRVHTEATLVSVGNGPCYGGGMRICPAAELDDGLLEVSVVGPVSRRRLVRLFPLLYRGRHVDLPEVQTFRGRRVSVSAPDTWAYADGERLASLPLVARAVPSALVARGPRE